MNTKKRHVHEANSIRLEKRICCEETIEICWKKERWKGKRDTIRWLLFLLIAPFLHECYQSFKKTSWGSLRARGPSSDHLRKMARKNHLLYEGFLQLLFKVYFVTNHTRISIKQLSNFHHLMTSMQFRNFKNARQ